MLLVVGSASRHRVSLPAEQAGGGGGLTGLNAVRSDIPSVTDGDGSASIQTVHKDPDRHLVQSWRGRIAHGCLLQSQLGGGIVLEELDVPDVAPDHFEGPVPGLAHDGQFVRSVQVGLRGQAGPQAMAGVRFRIEARGLHGTLDDHPDRVFVKPFSAEVAVPVHSAEDRAGRDARPLNPTPVGPDRAGSLTRTVRKGDFPSLPFLVRLLF